MRRDNELAGWRSRALSPDAVAARFSSGQRVYLQGAAATPTALIKALCARPDLEQMRLYSLHLEGPTPFAEPELRGRFRSVSLFVGPKQRAAVASGEADFISVFLRNIPGLFLGGTLPLDVAVVRLSPPDRFGLCTLGTSVDASLAAVQAARYVFAEISENVPRTHGNTTIRFDQLDAFCVSDDPLHGHEGTSPSAVEQGIGERVAALIEDGSTLQMGIGAIPDATLRCLSDKLELGVHSEMFSDGLIPLIEGGVVTNRQKKVHPGRTVTTFVMGSQRLYDFVDDNPLIEFHPCDRTNDTALIRKNPKVVAINSAVELDLTGQVCADSIGHRIYSGIGGQMELIHAAALSSGGKPIIALPSTAKGGQVSRISAALNTGAGVVTTRGHVHWVVTEHGAVNLHGMTLRERAEALISVAHPDHRPALRKQVRGVRHYPLT